MAKKTAKKGPKGKSPKQAPAAAETKGPGRPKDTRTVDELKAALAESEDPDDKRRLRAKLRARGHTGGLRVEGEEAESD